MPEKQTRYCCGIAPWRGVDAVFAASYGWSPATTYHEFHYLDVAPRFIDAENPWEAKDKFIQDTGLPFGEEIYYFLDRGPGVWTLYRWSQAAEAAGEKAWIEVDSF